VREAAAGERKRIIVSQKRTDFQQKLPSKNYRHGKKGVDAGRTLYQGDSGRRFVLEINPINTNGLRKEGGLTNKEYSLKKGGTSSRLPQAGNGKSFPTG